MGIEKENGFTSLPLVSRSRAIVSCASATPNPCCAFHYLHGHCLMQFGIKRLSHWIDGFNFEFSKHRFKLFDGHFTADAEFLYFFAVTRRGLQA